MLVGKMYIEEHNDLSNLGLKIDLKKVNLVEFPYGIILSQNISPGKIVKEGSIFVLTVNESKTIVPVPSLVGVSEPIALKMLNVIPVGKTTFNLLPGVITTIPHPAPKGEVLAQFPPANTPVLPDSPVMMLISEGPDKLKTGFHLPDLKKSNIEIIKKLSYDLQIPIKINPVITYDYWKNGEIEKIHYGRSGSFYFNKNQAKQIWDVYVYRYISDDLNSYPYQMRWVDIKDTNLEGKELTLFEKPAFTDSQYQNSAYVMMGKTWPVFFHSETRLEMWQGYQEKINILTDDMMKSKITPDYQKRINGIKI